MKKFLSYIYRKTKWFFIICITLLSLVVWTANTRIKKATDSLVYSDINKIPYNKVGLLLGTSKHLQSGLPNQYFINRIKATLDLYKAGKIDYVVISGDNSKKEYNEPLDMKNILVKSGIPENKIFLDYAGFRTYDSVIRINKIFGQTGFTVISQEFHNRRAIFIARTKNLKAIGYNAMDVNAYNGFKTNLREKFARVKVFLDLMVNKNPRFLGQPIEVK